MKHCGIDDCSVDGNQCVVNGSYKAVARDGRNEDVYQGEFAVQLVLKDFDYWYINAIRMEGFNP